MRQSAAHWTSLTKTPAQLKLAGNPQAVLPPTGCVSAKVSEPARPHGLSGRLSLRSKQQEPLVALLAYPEASSTS